MRITKKISIDRIFSKIYNDFGFEEIDESAIIEWTGDVLSQLDVEKAYEERVSFLEVKNHQAELPPHIISILRVAKNNKFDGKTCLNQGELDNMGCSNPTVADNTLVPCIGNLPLITSCGSYTEFPCGSVHRKPNITFNYPYYNWIDSDTYVKQFSIMGPSTDSFKTGLICEVSKIDKERLFNTSSNEYQIVEGRYIRTSFKEGQIAVAFLSQPVDLKTGYPLIPDEISVISAITNYILFMYCRKMHIMGRPGYKEKYKEAEADYQWYMAQAKNKLYFPHGIDEFQRIIEQRYSFIPNIYKWRNTQSNPSLRRSAQDDINYINRHNG